MRGQVGSPVEFLAGAGCVLRSERRAGGWPVRPEGRAGQRSDKRPRHPRSLCSCSYRPIMRRRAQSIGDRRSND